MSEFYNQIAEKYDFIFPLSPAHKTFFASELRGYTVLDVGAATGNLTDHLLSEGYEVTAIDLSERLIAKAAEKGITVQQLNMLAIDELSTFDNIVCRIAICKPVGHQHIENVGIGEPFALIAAHDARF